jgi:hypothetical protein
MIIELDDDKRSYLRDIALADEVRRRDSDTSLGPPSILARTSTLGRYPSISQCYFVCQPLILLGAEIEGGPGVVTSGSAVFYALNAGTSVPPPGTEILTTLIGNRWVFRYDG